MLLVVVSSIVFAWPGPEPVEYEQRAVEHRKRIQSFHYVAVTTSYTPPYEEEPEKRVGERLEAWADGDRYRCDRTPVAGWPSSLQSQVLLGGGSVPIPVAGTRATVCRGCRPDGAYLEFFHPGTPVTFYRPTAQEQADFDHARLDPRGLGLDRNDGRGTRPPLLPGRLINSKFQYMSAEPVNMDGEAAVLVRGTRVGVGSQHRCWVVPAKGYNVVRYELSGKPDAAGKEKPGLIIENELALDAASGIWFPKSSRCRQHYPNGLVAEQTVTVEVAEFNRPPDPAVFSLAGLGLSKGAHVLDRIANNGVQFWSGDKLTTNFSGTMPPEVKALAAALPPPDAVNAAVTPAAAPPTPDPTRTPTWVYALAAGLAVAGGGLLVLALRFRR